MKPRETIGKRYTSADPCPVCDRGSKGCSVTVGGLQLCRGTPTDPDLWADVLRGEVDSAGFHHYRQRDDGHQGPQAVFNPPPPPTEWERKAKRYAGALDTDKRAALADALGLPPSAVDTVPLIGWKADEAVYTFPERDGLFAVTGILRRSPNGAVKKAMSDSQRGLTIPAVVADQTDPVDVLFVVEGPTDVMAMTAAGLMTVGRPNNSGGSAFLAELFRHRKYQQIVVVGENDEKPDGLWPGREGGVKVAKELAASLGKPVSLAMPPDGAKDVRIWLTDQARGVTPWPDRGEELARRLTANAERIDPTAATATGSDLSGRRMRLEVVDLSTVTMKAVQWVWPKLIPRGMVTILFGPPGTSKSIVVCALTAAITTGGYLPGGEVRAAVGSVVLPACEDPIDSVVTPRMAAAGAELTRVKMITGKRPEGQDPADGFALAVNLLDIELIAAAIPDDCRMLVLDPIGSYIGAGVDSHKDNEARAVLLPLAALAERRGIAVVIVAHNNKTMANNLAIDAILGSRAFSGVVRSAIGCIADPEAADYPKRKLLLHAKTNLGPLADGLAYRLVEVPELPGCPPRIEWEAEPLAGVVADDYFGQRAAGGKSGPEPSAVEKAMAFLTSALAGQPNGVESNVIDRGAEASAISEATLRRAKQQLGVTAKQPTGWPKGVKLKWYCGVGEWTPPPFEPEPHAGPDKPTSSDSEDVSTWDTETTQPDGEQGLPPDAQAAVEPEHLTPGARGVYPEAHRTPDAQVELPSEQLKRAKKNRGGKRARTPGAQRPVVRGDDPDPLTDQTAFEALLRRRKWDWVAVGTWLDGQDEYVPDPATFSALTEKQKRLVIAHLSGEQELQK